jgi:hypothetical protein
MRVAKLHSEWKGRVTRETFDRWLVRYFDEHGPVVLADDTREWMFDAFMYGLEGVGHEYNGLTMEDCGQPECQECHVPEEDPMGPASRYV